MTMLDILRTYTNPLERAVALAVEAHSGQTDKQEKPYILHVLRVMMMGGNDEEKITGVLHDLLEDTDYTSDDLLRLGFTQEIVDAVVALTHKKGQSLAEYYDQIKRNSLALRVKRYDIDDNSNRLWSLKNEAIRQRLTQKYEWARHVLFGDPYNVTA